MSTTNGTTVTTTTLATMTVEALENLIDSAERRMAYALKIDDIGTWRHQSARANSACAELERRMGIDAITQTDAPTAWETTMELARMGLATQEEIDEIAGAYDGCPLDGLIIDGQRYELTF
jgi:hypothetical protein